MFKKFFLVKEIKSKEGIVHFRRYQLLSTPFGKLYLHQILASDEDLDKHDHPWDFESVILSGAYDEFSTYPPNFDEVYYNKYYQGDTIRHKAEDAHKIKLRTKEVWTLVWVSGRNREWGYQTPAGWVDHQKYRQLKNDGELELYRNNKTL